MKKLTNSAQNRLDKYLSQTRTSLHACTSVDADEVERDIRDHIETELQGMSEPVSLKDLEAVLDRLGSPSQWVPEEELSWWRKIILRLRTGPEDWRLAYICFGLFILAFLLVGRLSFIVLLLASFCVSRAVLSMAKEPEELSGKKWLIYPPLFVIYTPVFFFILLWPLVVLYGLTLELGHSGHPYEMSMGLTRIPYTSTRSGGVSGVLIALIIMGFWWTVLGIIGCIGPHLFKAIFRPFADKFKRKWAGLLLGIGLLLIIVCLGGWLLFTASSGHFMHRGFLRPF